MNCAEARQLFSPMLDSMLDGDQTQSLDAHLSCCKGCSTQYASLRRTKWLMATMAPHPAPIEMVLRLKVAASQQLASRRSNRWEAL